MRLPKGRFERLIIKGLLWIGILLLAALAVLLMGSTWEVYQKEKSARAERDIAINSHDSLTERKEKLAEDLAALESERGLEEEFRRRFPVSREGEEVIILVDARDAALEDTAAEESGFWSIFKGWFGL